MRYAEVSVNSPAARRQAFSYSIPPNLPVSIGQGVLVPFGSQTLQGIVLELSDHPSVAETREITSLLETRPLLSPQQIALAGWISKHYISPLFEAVALMLPPGFERKALTFLHCPLKPDEEPPPLNPEQGHVLELIPRQDITELRQLEKRLGKKKARSIVSQLVDKGLVTRSYELAPLRVKPKTELHLSLTVSPARAMEEAANLARRAPRQAALLEFMAQHTEGATWPEVRESLGPVKPAANSLAGKGLIHLKQAVVKREPFSRRSAIPTPPISPTSPQEHALRRIRTALCYETREFKQPAVFLLHGVTGSGKTEVYLQALAEAVRLGKRAIVLVPEIALTPQTIERFNSRFPGKVAVLHSQLSLGEQYDEWQRIRDGEFDVVIGSRSAIFAPQPKLGLIIIDEEHEWTYKQSDRTPRYHARQVATKLSELSGAVLVLGSATPDIETFYRTQRGDYHILSLPERVTPNPGTRLPPVEIVDMRTELKAGNRSLFSHSLTEAITDALIKRGQVILFLNRRGGATFIQCRNCGFTLRCRRCDVPLSYHPAENRLTCHQCNQRVPLPPACPQCSSRQIKMLGAGTQKIEQEIARAFPQARLLRWDSDVTHNRRSHQEILDRFRRYQADILIGTQMIAKGLDIPRITLVGVINADTGLNRPDFRAGERTFQLLSQVAGRAGRGVSGGRAVIQTYSPKHYAILAAARQDYALFYRQEITYRQQLRYPPFSQLADLTYNHPNNTACRQEAERIHRVLTAERDAAGLPITFIGPAPAFIQRRRGHYRWQLILRGSRLSGFLDEIPFPRGWTVDIEPIGLA